MARKFLTDIDLAKNSLNNARIQNLSADPSSPVVGQTYFNTTSNKLRTYNGSTWDEYGTGAGSGSVTSVSVASANGLAGTVAAATTTPAITLSTTVTGLLKGNGTAISAATSGTDYAPATATTSSLKGNGSGGFTAATLNDNGTATADYSIGGFKLTNVATPISGTDAANKSYVDAAAQGLDVKNSTVAATTGSESFTVTSGSVTQISGTSLDGVSPAVSDRILIKDAPSTTGTGSAGSTQPGNGIYIVTSNTTNLSVSRAIDQSGTNNPQGDFVFVEGGTTNGANGYVVTVPSTTGSFTYGTNNIKWSQFSGAGQITAGTGLSKSGNTLSLSTPVTVANGGTGAGTITGLVKGNGTSAFTAAVSGTDYAPATSGSNILKGNGSGGFSSAKYTANIGDGSTTAIAVTHSLGTQDVLAQVRDASTNAVVECDITQTSTSVTTFTFAVAPATNAYKVVIIG